MAYADYGFYITDYLGNAIELADFSRLASRASTWIDRLTFGRAAAVMALEGEVGEDTATVAKIKKATCAAAEEIQQLESSGGVVTSERIGNVSVTYADGRGEGQRVSDSVKAYLWDTDLMYRSFAEGEI